MKTTEPRKIISAGVRDAGEEWHIECRFSNGEKYAAVRVDKECENLADYIATKIIGIYT